MNSNDVKNIMTSLHVERGKGSMGGRLTASTLHPAFEALVHGVAAKAKKPQLLFAVTKENHLRITLGGCTSANPIQRFDKELTAIVWMLTFKGAQKWPLKMVDQLHKRMQMTDTPGRGFFTLPEFVAKSHSMSALHLVMERDTEKDVARIFAMMPVSKAEINVVDKNPASTKGVQKKRPAKRPRTCDSTEGPAKKARHSDGSQTGAPAPAPGSPLVPPSLPGPPTRRHSAEADNGLPGTWRIANGRKRLTTQDSDDSDVDPVFASDDDDSDDDPEANKKSEKKIAAGGDNVSDELRRLRRQVEELTAAKAAWRQRSEDRAEARQQLLMQVEALTQALQLERSNVKIELESAHSKAAADSTVRQKEIQDARHTLTDQKNSCCACFSIYMFTYISCA
jgi:hypothetical protein